MSWIFYTLLAVCIWACVNIIDKYVLVKWVKNPVVPVLVLGLISLIVGVVLFWVRGFGNLFPSVIFLAVLAGCIYTFSILFYFMAVKREEISRVIPVLYTAPMFVAVLAFIFLGESFSASAYLGIVLLIFGSVLITYKKGIRLNVGFWLVVLCAFFMAVFDVILKYVLNFSDYWTVFAYTRVGTFIAVVPLLFIYLKDLGAAVKGVVPVVLMSFAEMANLVALFFFTVAFSVGAATLIAGLSAVQPFVVFMFTIFLSVFIPSLLKEELRKSVILLKLLAIALIVAGVLLVT